MGLILSGDGTITSGSIIIEGNLKQSNGFYLNSTTITENYTIPTGDNAMSAGPVTVADGVTIVVPDGSTWTVV